MESLPSAVRTYTSSEIEQVKLLSEGTTSTVSLAVIQSVQVAVKSLKPEDEIEDRLTRQRMKSDFDNELEINIALRHPNIVHLIGIVCDPQLRSLIFEYCDGGVLSCNDYGVSKLPAALAVATAIANAVCYAHGLGIMHRDIKPSQICFRDGIPKLGDWGLATFCSDTKCATGETGTWEFMAPEVIRSEPYGTPADVYSFGVLLFCLVNGEGYPYGEMYLAPAHAAIGVAKQGLRPRISHRIPERIAQIIIMCWASEPSLRPSMDVVVSMLSTTEQAICQ